MPGIVIYGKPSCEDTQRSLKLLDTRKVAYRWVNVEEDAAGRQTAMRNNGGKLNTPTIVFDDGSVLVEPSDTALTAKLGLPDR